jgi:hypothetical protein
MPGFALAIAASIATLLSVGYLNTHSEMTGVRGPRATQAAQCQSRMVQCGWIATLESSGVGVKSTIGSAANSGDQKDMGRSATVDASAACTIEAGDMASGWEQPETLNSFKLLLPTEPEHIALGDPSYAYKVSTRFMQVLRTLCFCVLHFSGC